MLILNSGYDIGFDARSQFLLSNSKWDKNIVIFVVNNSSFVHADDIKKDVLLRGGCPTDGLNDAAIIAEAKEIYFV